MHRLIFKIEPMGKETVRGGRNGFYTSYRCSEYMKKIKYYAYYQWGNRQMLKGALKAEISFFVSKPKSVPKSRELPSVKPDLDNMLKALLDSIQGVVFQNDSQITDLNAIKRYSTDPHICIDICEIHD